MTTLSQSLLAAADKADVRAQEAIDAGDAETAEVALRNAANFRRLAVRHRSQAILSGDPSDDPPQIAPAESVRPVSEIAARRQALGMTQTELAEALDVTQTTLSRWETGAVPVSHPGMLWLALEALALTGST